MNLLCTVKWTNHKKSRPNKAANDEDEFPVYGKGNKEDKTGRNEDEDDDETSGFVDNKIYSSSGPL